MKTKNREQLSYTIAMRLLAERTKRGLSQLEVAKGTKLTQPNISYYEQGSTIPSVVSLYLLAQFYGVSVDYLLGMSEKKIYKEG